MKKNFFSLIELLIVIAILGVLSATIIPKFMDVESDAVDAVAGFNASSLSSFVSSYSAANGGKLPSRMHTGLTADGNELDNLPLIIRKHLETGHGIEGTTATSAELNQPYGLEIINGRKAPIYSGIAELAYDPDDAPIIKKVKDAAPSDLKMFRVKGNIFAKMYAEDDTKFDGRYMLRPGGMTLNDWVEFMPYKTSGVAANYDGYDVVMFFLGKDTRWGAVYDANGNAQMTSRATAENVGNRVYRTSSTDFLYPVIFLKMHKQHVSVIGVATFNEDGSEMVFQDAN